MTNAADILRANAKTFAQRHAIYGDNYKLVGQAMRGLFPNGLPLATAQDHNRAHIFYLIMVKLSRYAQNWEQGGHQDSIHDAAIYCAMLEAIDVNRNDDL